MSKPILWIVIPCYNEEQVLPITAPMFLEKIHSLAAQGLVSEKSRVLFVNDGSKDKTWELIQNFAAQDEHYIGIAQSRNRGHQNAVLAGLMEALHSGTCDITISIDCDGQDDINAMDEMVKKYQMCIRDSSCGMPASTLRAFIRADAAAPSKGPVLPVTTVPSGSSMAAAGAPPVLSLRA